MTRRSIELLQSGKPLGPKDWRFHFYAWWMEPKYVIPAEGVTVTKKQHEYFDEVEAKVKETMGVDLRPNLHRAL